MSAAILVGLLAAVALAVMLWRKAPRRYPYRARAPLTPNEAEFFARLVVAFPEGFVRDGGSAPRCRAAKRRHPDHALAVPPQARQP